MVGLLGVVAFARRTDVARPTPPSTAGGTESLLVGHRDGVPVLQELGLVEA
jgi:hypothetical protein